MTYVYTCTGSCHGVVAEQDYQNGKHVCGGVACERRGQPFKKYVQCQGCENAGPNHVCPHCKLPYDPINHET